MKKILKSGFFIIGVLWIAAFFCVFTSEVRANTGEPLPPPVNIEFTVENVPQIGEELTLKLKVTSLEDMHVDISCLLPGGIEAVREQGVMVQPYMDRRLPTEQRQAIYMEAVELWVGPLRANTTKEFTFSIIIPDKQTYELIAVVEALAKWGVKEETLVINTDQQ